MVILTGSGDDRYIISNIISMVEHRDSVINTCGRFSIPEICCRIKRFNLLITVDSFPMHVASAVGTPGVAIFSAVNDPKRWGPYGEGNIVLFKDVPCSPCLQGRCPRGNNVCMEMISTEEVTRVITKKLVELGWKQTNGRKV